MKDSELSFAPLKGLSHQAPKKAVYLTFDDGYLSFYDTVFPTLVAEDIPATLFIITDYVGRCNDWEVTFRVNQRRHLGWDQIREISAAGIEIGSHTRIHRDLTRLSSDELQGELEDSRKILEEHTGKEVTSLALPFGAVNLDVFACAREVGYQEICGGAPGFRGPFPGVLPRMPVYRWDGARSLKRKLELSLWETVRLRGLQFCSRGTRLLKK